MQGGSLDWGLSALLGIPQNCLGSPRIVWGHPAPPQLLPHSRGGSSQVRRLRFGKTPLLPAGFSWIPSQRLIPRGDTEGTQEGTDPSEFPGTQTPPGCAGQLHPGEWQEEGRRLPHCPFPREKGQSRAWKRQETLPASSPRAVPAPGAAGAAETPSAASSRHWMHFTSDCRRPRIPWLLTCTETPGCCCGREAGRGTGAPKAIPAPGSHAPAGAR